LNWSSGTKYKSVIKFCDKDILNSSLIKKDSGWSVDRYKFECYDKLRIAIESIEAKVSQKLRELNTGIESNIEIITSGLKSNVPNSFKTYIQTNKGNKTLLYKKLTELVDLNPSEDYIVQKAIFQKDSNLSIQDFSNQIELNKSKIELLEKILNYIVEITHIYSKVDENNEKINRTILLKESIDFSKFEQYELLFSPLVHKESYIDLLKKIADTALKFGYKNYPEEVEKCFYCNQTLKDDNKSLLKSIHELVENQANQEVQALNNEIKLFSSRIDQAITKIISESDYIEVDEICSISDKQLLNIHDIQRNVLSKESLELLKSEVG